MEPLKINHMPGGKVLAVILFILVIVLFFAAIALFLAPHVSVGFIAGIALIVAVASCIWLAYKFYKPGFTDVLFTEEGIISKTPSERSELRIEDMKSIWITKLPVGHHPFEEYGPHNLAEKNTLIYFGDIDYFDGASFFGLMGAPSTLHDTFTDDYATIYYRKGKGMDEFFEYYYKKIKEREQREFLS